MRGPWSNEGHYQRTRALLGHLTATFLSDGYWGDPAQGRSPVPPSEKTFRRAGLLRSWTLTCAWSHGEQETG